MPLHIISVQVTYAEVTALIAANALQAGAIYKITDRGDRGLFFHAISESKLAKDGTRLMLCPARYSSNEVDAHGNSWKGVWNNTKTVAANDLVIWGAKVWKNLTGAIGSSPDDLSLDEVNWQVITKSGFTNNEYVELSFGVSYDVANDWIERQWDTSGNTFGLDYVSFQWWDGREGVNYCDISDWNYSANNDSNIMFNNKVICIFNNSNTGSINGNSNTGSIIGNSNTASIIGNSNTGDIYNNSSAGGIFTNSNIGGIYSNSNTGYISTNSNAGEISYNSNAGEISYNSNAGEITSIGPANAHIRYNRNNGGIFATTTGDITDAVVNK